MRCSIAKAQNYNYPVACVPGLAVKSVLGMTELSGNEKVSKRDCFAFLAMTVVRLFDLAGNGACGSFE